MNKMFETVSILFLLAAAVFVFLRMHEANSLFAVSKEHEIAPGAVGLSPEEVFFKSGRAGENVHAWYFGKDNNAATLLYIHGNAGTIADRLPVIKGYVENGLDVFIYDFRGYGKSEGKATKKNFIEDAFAAYGYLTKERGISPEKIAILGQSLGGVAALRLATAVKCRTLILEGTFYSIRQMAKDIYPYIPIWIFASSDFDNAREIKKLSVPVLFIHGADDGVVPFNHSKMLYSLAAEPKELLKIERSGHTTMFETDPAAYYGTIKRFIEEAGSM